MRDRRCRYCQQPFRPAPFHPEQWVCSRPQCRQQQRRAYHRRKIRSDPVYAEVVRDSRRKWREAHPNYQQQYRHDHPQAVEQNREGQHLRDQRRRLGLLVKNNLALDLRHCPAEAWLLGPAATDLVKNNLAGPNLLILRPWPAAVLSCKEQPSG